MKTEGGEPAANVSVFCDGTLLPERTDSNGQLTHTFDAATSSAHVVYAMDDDGGRSWNVNTPVCDWATDGNGEPFGIQNVAVKHAELNATITWMSAIGEGNANGYIRYAEDKTNVSSAENVEAASKVLAFAQHTETGEKLVVYQGMYPPFKICARPYDMFMSEVDREKYPKIRQKYRFEKIKL